MEIAMGIRRSLTMVMPTWLTVCCGSSVYAKAYRPLSNSNHRMAPPGIMGGGHRSLQQMIQISAQLPIGMTAADNDNSRDDGISTVGTVNTNSILKDDKDEFPFSEYTAATSVTPSSCPPTCNSELCACLEQPNDGTFRCASEIHNVCTTSEVELCVPPDSVDYFESFYCSYAECLLGGQSEAECTCDFYQQHCDMYDDEDSVKACEVANCCLEQSDDNGREQCMERMSSSEFVATADSEAQSNDIPEEDYGWAYTNWSVPTNNPVTAHPTTTGPSSVQQTGKPTVPPAILSENSLEETDFEWVSDSLSMPLLVREMSMPVLEVSEMSMPLEESEMSFPLELSEMSMVMTDELSPNKLPTPAPFDLSELATQVNYIEVSEMSMPALEVGEMSMPLEVSEMSIPLLELSEMSMPLEESEMSMFLELSGMSFPLGLSELSMAVTEDLSHNKLPTPAPFDLSELATQVNYIEVSEPPSLPPSIVLIDSSSPTESPTRKPTRNPTRSPSRSPSTERMGDVEGYLSMMSMEMIEGPGELPVRKPTRAPTSFLTKSPTFKPSTQGPNFVPTTDSPAMPLEQNELPNSKDNPAKPPKESPATKPPKENPPSKPPKDSESVAPLPKVTKPEKPTAAPTTSSPPSFSASNVPTQSPTQRPTQSPAKEGQTMLSPTTPPTANPTAQQVVPVVVTFPTKKPTPQPVTNVETDIQLQLVGVSSAMDDEATNVFEQSCATFLNDMLVEATPPIFDVECQVTNQQLVSGRRLRALQEGEPSLLVDVNIKGSAYHEGSVTEPEDIPFGDLVYGTFTVHSKQFVNQLKADGTQAEIDDFGDLSAVYTIKSEEDMNSIQNPDGGNSGGNNEDNTNKGKGTAIAAIVISGVVMLGLFTAYFIHVVRRRSDESNDGDAESEPEEDVYHDSLLYGISNPALQQSHSYPEVHKLPPDHPSIREINVESGDSRNENLTYMYSLDDGLASPSSSNLSGNTPTSSMMDRMQQQHWIEGMPPPPKRIRIDVVAPPGKLGIIIDTCSEGPIVHSVKPTSPLEGSMFKGDLVVAVDDEDTREWSAHYLTKLVAKKSKYERKITLLRDEADHVLLAVDEDAVLGEDVTEGDATEGEMPVP